MASVADKKRRRKIFKERISLYQHLCEVNPYFDGLYTTCKIQFSLLVLYILFRDSFQMSRLHYDFHFDRLVLGELNEWMVFWLMELMYLLLFVSMYGVFLVWMQGRQWLGGVATLLYLALSAAYVGVNVYFVWFMMSHFHLSPVPKTVTAIEMTRFLLKYYSFVRENAYKVVYPWHKDDDSGPAVWYAGQMSPQVGSFSQYVYFLFAPTLLYRDHYPRNKGSIRWKHVFLYAVQFLGAYVVSRFMFLVVQPPASMRLVDLLHTYFTCLVCAPFMSFLASILVFNAWSNFTAELTRFADREFYQDWWSALGYSEYYRKWNIPIYDFLFTYVYQDLKLLMPHQSLASLPALILSSLAHDILMIFALGLVFPLFIFMFAFLGGIVLVSGVKFSKPLTFFFTALGVTIFQCFYYTELTARHHCPKENIGPSELRMLYCFQAYNNHTLF